MSAESCSIDAHSQPSGSFGQVRCVRWLGFLVLSSAAPLSPPLIEDALQELGAGFVPAALAAGEFGFGGDEAAFDGGFEDGGLVALEVGLDALEVGDGFVEAGELLFDFGDDLGLRVQWREWEHHLLEL